MDEMKKANVGIGFATGRKSFQKVLNTNIRSWKECGLTENPDVRLNLLVAYDLKYSGTRYTDYTNIRRELLELIDDTYFIGSSVLQREISLLKAEKVIDDNDARLFFGGGYAAKRNAVLYTALKNKMDYLIFLDDDEYPMAVTKTRGQCIWSGQHVLKTHLENIRGADMTNGHHCGYISPIPYIEFNSVMSEATFRIFIEAISNDIISWNKIRSVMNDGGVTYADKEVLINENAEEVNEKNRAKFISGANLCINLTDPSRLLPFYNPPGARGEDTFLGTCLSERRVLRVPVYTFHDGFSTYRHLMDGVLPIKLKYIKGDSEKIIDRFYHACIGWMRYKPLLIYITDREHYEERIALIKKQLAETLPAVCTYFGRKDFMSVSVELSRYHRNVLTHYGQFLETRRIWSRLCDHLQSRGAESGL